MRPPDNGRGTAPADRPSQIHRLAGTRITSRVHRDATICPMACAVEWCPMVCPSTREMLNRPTIRSGTPASWDEMVFLGFDPLTGERLAVAS